MLRFLRGFGKFLGWFIAGLVGLVVLVALAIQLPPVRGLIRDQVLAAVRGSVQGEIALDDVRWPTPENLEISGLTVKDKHGNTALSLATLMVNINLPALTSGQVDIRSVEVSSLYVDLAELDEQRGLLSLFASDKPEPPPQPKDPNAPMSPITVAIRELCIDHGEVRVKPAAEQAFTVDRLEGCVRMRIAKGFYVATNVLQARVQQNDRDLAVLRAAAELPALKDEHPAGTLLAALDAKLELLGEDMSFDAWVKGRGFSPETLRALGIETDVLTGRVNLDLHARQLESVLGYRAEIHSRAGHIDARGELDKERVVSLHVLTPRLDVAAISSIDLPRLGFALDAEAALADPKQTELRANLTRGYFDNFALPVVSAQAVQKQDGTTVLQSLKANYGNAAVSGNGELAASGALRAQVDVAVPDLAALPPLKSNGAPLRGDVRAQLNVSRDVHDMLDARVRLSSNALLADAAQAQGIQLDAHMSQIVARPVLEVDLRANELAAGGQVFTQVGIGLDGGPQRYLFVAKADEEKLRAEGWVEPSLDNAWDASLAAQAQFPQGPLRVRVPKLRLIPGESVQVSDVLAEFVSAKLRADGRIAFQGPGSKLRFSAEAPDMKKLLQALGQPEQPGRLTVTGLVQGELQRPAADLEVRYLNGPQFNGEPSRVALDLHAKAERGTSTLTLSASAGSARVESKVESKWARSLPLAAALQAAKHEVELSLRDTPLASLLDPQSPLPSRLIDGIVNADIKAHGNLDKLQLESEVRSRLHTARDKRSVDAVLKADYRDALVKVSADLGDRRGQLWNLRASAGLDVERQIAKPTPSRELIDALPWELETELFERRIGELPYLASQELEAEVRALRLALKAQVGHAPHAEPSGTFESQLQWEPPRVISEKNKGCRDRARGKALLAAKWADQKLGVELSGGAQTNEAIKISGRARVPFSELIAGGLKELAGVQLAAKLRELNLQELPFACRSGRGLISLDAEARDMLTPRAKVTASAQTKALVWEDSPELNLDLKANTVEKALIMSVDMQAGAGKTHIQGRVPLDVHASDPSQMMRAHDPVELDMRMERMPMATLLAVVPVVKRVSGTTGGQMRLRGSLEKPMVKGELKLDDVSFTLPRLGQRFSHLNLKVGLDGTTLRLSEGRVKDLDGSATVAALVQIPSLSNITAEVNVNARNFPLRNSGVIMGRADLDAKIKADMTRQQTRISVGLNNVAIILSGDGMGNVQSLEDHPEFAFVDQGVAEIREELTKPAEEEKAPQPNDRLPMVVHVIARDGVWVRRDDFAVQMQPDLLATIEKSGPSITGEIKLLRGYINLLGQSFDIKRGRVVLAGGETIDPQLQITAQHDSTGGQRVRVEVTGFAREPRLAFYVDDKAVTARDALVAITGGGRGGSSKGGSPEAQIASAAVGMTTGLLTLGARREFGDWVPMLAIEQGDNTRVRVGVEADRFIPKFLEGFVKGAYVEGIVSTQSNANNRSQGSAASSRTASSASGTGVLLELMLPSHFVWAGQYGPGQAWSIDLDWRP
jgi:autotransporter translocation and assembly factor TamB